LRTCRLKGSKTAVRYNPITSKLLSKSHYHHHWGRLRLLGRQQTYIAIGWILLIDACNTSLVTGEGTCD